MDPDVELNRIVWEAASEKYVREHQDLLQQARGHSSLLRALSCQRHLPRGRRRARRAFLAPEWTLGEITSRRQHGGGNFRTRLLWSRSEIARDLMLEAAAGSRDLEARSARSRSGDGRAESEGPESIEGVANFKAVMFDWRGTLVFTPSELEWARSGLQRAGLEASEEAGRRVLSQIVGAPDLERLSAPGVDSDARRHREAYLGVFLDAGLDPALGDALYAVESDATLNPFASDVATVLGSLKNRGVKIAVLSDIHFDLRPAFEQAGLAQFIDVFVLSFELGAQKPEPEIFQHALRALGMTPDEVLMVGDRAGYDGAAVDLRIPTLLLPPLTSVDDRRLHLVEALVG